MTSIRVVEYYANKSIFLTGASGFIGKVLIEKLLRCCPDIKAIYLLMRGKKGMSPQDRLDQLTRSQCFEKIKDIKLFSKLRVISGDIHEEHLGMSHEDRIMLQQEIQIVLHSAASVRFDSSLRDAVNSNVIGTKSVLEFANGIKNLEVLLYISTTFCHDDLEVVEEKLYPALNRPQHIIDCIRWMSDEMLQIIQPNLIKPFVNTYGYSKNLAEEIVAQYEGKFPLAIGRPSIVVASYKEPFPGWVDNINGATGALYAGASGIYHSLHSPEDCNMDVIPVDAVANSCILLAYSTGIERPKNVRVCNIADPSLSKVSWNEASEIVKKYIVQYPLSRALYYPAGSSYEYLFQHKLAQFFFQTLPAYFIDLLLFLFGQKTFMVRIIKRVNKGTDLLGYYTSRTWVFNSEYFRSLRNQITEEENEIFFTDMSIVDYSEYMKNYYLGVRKFIAKEDESTLPQARRLMGRLYYLHMTLKTLFYVALTYFTYCIFVNFW